MCFSAEVSFTASAVLGGIAYLNYKAITNKNQLPLALIPAFFALQQFSEGVLWLTAPNGFQPFFAAYAAQYIFLFFAFLFWPIWIPLSLYMVEKVSWRKNVIFACLAAGVIFDINILKIAVEESVNTKVAGNSIRYVTDIPSQVYFYAPIVLLPCFITSYRSMWMFAVLTTVSFGVAMYVYTEAFTSVWCFFSAIISLLIYKVLRDNREPLKMPSAQYSKIDNPR